MIKDKYFYDKESARYSLKRYPETTSNYIQFFFKKRLDIVLRELKEIFGNKMRLNLLEIGCADGVVLRKILEEMGNNFSEMIGIDTSEGMIKEAGILTTNKKIRYFLRGEEVVSNKLDVVLEIGVANYAHIDEELEYAENNLKEEGIYVLSLAGKGSLNEYLGTWEGYSNFLSYSEYENKIDNIFKINKVIPIGFYVPFIWKVPAVGRVLQPLFEFVFRLLLPNLFHEKVYILKKNQ